MASLCCILKRLTRQAKLAGTVGARPVWSAMSQNLTSLQRACAQTHPRTRVAAVNFALHATGGRGIHYLETGFLQTVVTPVSLPSPH